MRPVLMVHELRAAYGSIEVLKGLSFSVAEGEMLSVIGANGAGKTTLLACLSGLLVPSGGTVSFFDKPITLLPANARVSQGLILVPEGRRIFPKLTVLENLEMGAYLRIDRDGIKSDLERVFSLFPILKDRQRQAGGTLSGGEQQMLAIGRALMSQPKILLMDEPSMGVAPMLVARIFETIAELNRSGMTIILVEQNAKLALRLSHRALVLETGTIVLEGKSNELLHDARVGEAYLGGA
jgi:branched-chain amino acid transport system ATP-binding protein